jgi:hypothetical protein
MRKVIKNSSKSYKNIKNQIHLTNYYFYLNYSFKDNKNTIFSKVFIYLNETYFSIIFGANT